MIREIDNNATSMSFLQMVIHTVRHNRSVRKATAYISPNEVVTATLLKKPTKKATHHSMLLTWGRPNYRGRMFIKACQKSGEPFPVKKIQIKHWPK